MKRLSVLPVAIAIGLGLLLTFTAVTSAQTPVPPTPSSLSPPSGTSVATLTIVGQVTNGTAGGTLPITTTVLLYGFDGQAVALKTSAIADAAGKVRFEGVENKPGRSFGLAATVGRTPYSSKLQTPQPGASELALTLKTYDTTTDASQVRVAEMYVVGEFPTEQELRIVNAYVLSNKGDRAIEDSESASDGRTATLRFSLPKGATNLEIREDSAERFIRTDDGFLTTWGLPPGDNVSQVVVRYTLPYTGQLHLESQVLYPVQVVKVLVADQGVALASPQLRDQGTSLRQDGVTLRSFTGEALAAGQALVFDLSGTPHVASRNAKIESPELVEAAGAPKGVALDLRQRIALGIVAFGLILLVAGAVWWAWSARRVENDEHAGVSPEHRVLVQTLTSLDEAHDAGEIDDIDYARQRPILKAALIRAFENP